MDRRLVSLAKYKREHMTRQERRLWFQFLAKAGIEARKQQIIGNYIVDFFLPDYGLCIELDGSGHYTAEGVRHDSEKDAALKKSGYTVLHYSNNDVNQNFRAVCEDILNHCEGF